MTDHQPDLGSCCVTDCLDLADQIGLARLKLPAEVGAFEDHLDLDTPLCGQHLHLLRMGVTSCDVDTRDS